MSVTYQRGDKVCLGNISGIVLGVYVESRVLFFADQEHECCYNSQQILSTGNKVDDISYLFIMQHFEIHNLTDANRKALSQKRFAIVDSKELTRGGSTNHTKHFVIPTRPPAGSLRHKRHLYINFIKRRYAEKADANAIENLWLRLEEVQNLIDEDEAEQKRIALEKEEEEAARYLSYAFSYEELSEYGIGLFG